MRPVDVPTYTPEGAAVPSGTIIIERDGSAQDVGPKLDRTAADIVRYLLQSGEMVMATQTLTDEQIMGFAESVGADVRMVDRGEEREGENQIGAFHHATKGWLGGGEGGGVGVCDHGVNQAARAVVLADSARRVLRR